MASDFSLRHLPDLSDASVMHDFSDSSFQIPIAAGSSNELLLGDDSLDLLRNADDTLATPAPPTTRKRPPLTLAELTPRTKVLRAAPVRSSLRPRLHPEIATPRRAVVARDLSSALTENFSPIRGEGTSFQIPISATVGHKLLAEEGNDIPDVDFSTFSGTGPYIPETAASPARSSVPQRAQTSPQPSDHLTSSPGMSALNPEVIEASLESTEQAETDAATRHMSDVEQIPAERIEQERKPRKQALQIGKTKRRKSGVIGGGMAKKTVKPKVPASTVARILSASAKRKSLTGQRRPVRDKSTSVRGVLAEKVATRSVHSSSGAVVQSTAGATAGGLVNTLIAFGQRTTQNLPVPIDINADCTDVERGTSTGAIAELAMAGSSSAVDFTTASHAEETTEVPLTLSQLSPSRKPAASTRAEARRLRPDMSGAADGAPHPSPTRSSRKRPQSAAPDASSHQRKRSKTDLSSSQTSSINQPLGEIKEDAVTDSQREVEVPAHESSIASRLRARKPSADPQAKEARVRPGNANSQARSPASTAQHGGRKNGGRRQLTHPPVAPSRSRSASKSGDLHNSQKENTSDARALRQEQDGHMHRSGHMPGLDKSSVALPPAKPTRPIEFHFHSDARIEARKAELEKSGSMQTRSRSHAPLPIPDFKAMHAAQESALAARKEQIMPVVPMEMELNTDVRARERGKYDEARRERELEIEQQMEERRRQRELEEEKEIRELRRRAVPKANEVPEWYANAPKRTGKPKT